ncbi:MAG: ribosome-associated translation inhibitor RaiA [Firmicutes bacterium]|nr:ribosome-associated translation inhibitor RaiA [Bacillota bacterium]
MKIHVRGDRHLDVTPALKEYAEKKLRRLERYIEQADQVEATVTMRVTRDVHSVEVTMPVSHMLLRAEERSPDMYASIDMVVDKLEKQLDKYRHKLGQKVGHRQKLEGSRAKEAVRLRSDLEPGRDEEEVLELFDGGALVRVKDFEMKPMDVQEAILQMDMLGHDFFVFANAQTERTNVVYRRRDGQYGVIQAR